MTDPPSYPGLPRWVKILGIIAIVLILLIIIALATGLGGPHGPRRHSPSGSSGVEPVPALIYSSAGPRDHTLRDGRDDVASRYFQAVAVLPNRPPARTVIDWPEPGGPDAHAAPIEQAGQQP